MTSNARRPRISQQDKAAKAEELLIMMVLWGLLKVYKSQTDAMTWAINGLPVEEFLDCLERGLSHPLLDTWQKRRSNAANRPAPSSRETGIRRLAVLACETLRRAGVTDKKARQLVAGRLARTKTFGDTLSADVLRNWRRALHPPPTPADETVIRNAQVRAGTDHQKIVDYFVGLMNVLHT